MGDVIRPIMRHLVAGVVGGVAAYVTAKTGQDLSQAVEPVTGAVLVGVYGAMNHLIKLVFPGTRGSV